MDNGWIKLSRGINSHWIWSDPVKFQWWIDILLTVNFTDTKVVIGYKVFDCKRGESLMSLLSWAKRWNVGKSVVNNFFAMLKRDKMIETKSETVTIRLKVCNYDSYQVTQNANKTQKNCKKTQGNTIEEREEGEERKEEYTNKFNFRNSLINLKIEEEIIDNFLLIRRKKKAVNTEIAFNALLREINKSGLKPSEAITMCVERSWSGFNNNWITNNNTNGTKRTESKSDANDRWREETERKLAVEYAALFDNDSQS